MATKSTKEHSQPNKGGSAGRNLEKGMPEGEEAGRWRQKLGSRADKLRYLENGERYWYGKDWFGSEKRKNPA